MCQEAVKAGEYSVAAKVLGRLHAQLVAASQLPLEQRAQHEPNNTLTEASVLRALITCITNGGVHERIRSRYNRGYWSYCNSE